MTNSIGSNQHFEVKTYATCAGIVAIAGAVAVAVPALVFAVSEYALPYIQSFTNATRKNEPLESEGQSIERKLKFLIDNNYTSEQITACTEDLLFHQDHSEKISLSFLIRTLTLIDNRKETSSNPNYNQMIQLIFNHQNIKNMSLDEITTFLDQFSNPNIILGILKLPKAALLSREFLIKILCQNPHPSLATYLLDHSNISPISKEEITNIIKIIVARHQYPFLNNESLCSHLETIALLKESPKAQFISAQEIIFLINNVSNQKSSPAIIEALLSFPKSQEIVENDFIEIIKNIANKYDHTISHTMDTQMAIASILKFRNGILIRPDSLMTLLSHAIECMNIQVIRTLFCHLNIQDFTSAQLLDLLDLTKRFAPSFEIIAPRILSHPQANSFSDEVLVNCLNRSIRYASGDALKALLNLPQVANFSLDIKMLLDNILIAINKQRPNQTSKNIISAIPFLLKHPSAKSLTADNLTRILHTASESIHTIPAIPELLKSLNIAIVSPEQIIAILDRATAIAFSSYAVESILACPYAERISKRIMQQTARQIKRLGKTSLAEKLFEFSIQHDPHATPEYLRINGPGRSSNFEQVDPLLKTIASSKSEHILVVYETIERLLTEIPIFQTQKYSPICPISHLPLLDPVIDGSTKLANGNLPIMYDRIHLLRSLALNNKSPITNENWDDKYWIEPDCEIIDAIYGILLKHKDAILQILETGSTDLLNDSPSERE